MYSVFPLKWRLCDYEVHSLCVVTKSLHVALNTLMNVVYMEECLSKCRSF